MELLVTRKSTLVSVVYVCTSLLTFLLMTPVWKQMIVCYHCCVAKYQQLIHQCVVKLEFLILIT